MMEAENDTLRERVAALEQKTHAQADEIVCLRSTLADVLRRVNLLEGHMTSAAVRSPLIQPSMQPSRNGVLRGKKFMNEQHSLSCIYN
jgi:uncharacterized coiled-coil protein SlyX